MITLIMDYSFDLVNTKAKRQDTLHISKQLLLSYYLRKILKRLLESKIIEKYPGSYDTVPMMNLWSSRSM